MAAQSGNVRVWLAMGVISRAIDELPVWARVALAIAAISLAIYGIHYYGFWSFLMHAIFSPD